jgi:hypothetical protein
MLGASMVRQLDCNEREIGGPAVKVGMYRGSREESPAASSAPSRLVCQIAERMLTETTPACRWKTE